MTLNHVNKIFSVTGQVRFDSACFTGRKESIASKSVCHVGTSSAVLFTTERSARELGIGVGRVRREFS